VALRSAEARAAVAYRFTRAGFGITTVLTAAEAMAALTGEYAAAVLLSTGLPDASVAAVMRDLRGNGALARVAVVLIDESPASPASMTRLRALELGADDFFPSSFDIEELTLRLTVLLRRWGATAPRRDDSVITAGRLTIDAAGCLTSIDGRPVDLTPSEFKILSALAVAHGRFRTREELFEAAGRPHGVTRRAIDMHVSRLREKLGASGPAIVAVRGTGYRLLVERL
jgi:DNA-binding response OmpR family regulator